MPAVCVKAIPYPAGHSEPRPRYNGVVDRADPGSVPRRPGRWRWLAFLVAALFAFLSIAIAVAVPRPSEASPHVASPVPIEAVNDCASDEWSEIARAHAGGTVVVHGRASETAAGDDGYYGVRIACEGGGTVAVRSATNLGGEGYFTLRMPEEGGVPDVTESCFGCGAYEASGDALSPRETAVRLHVTGTALGVFAALVFLLAWLSRPHDGLHDQISAAKGVIVLGQPSNDRIRLGGHVFSARHVAVERGALVERQDPPTGAHVRLPGAAVDYREGAAGLAMVIGPARLNGVRIARGEARALADGDLLDLRGHPVLTVGLPQPGRLLRYCAAGDARLAIVGRRRSPWAVALGVLLGALVASIFVVLHLDVSGWLASAGLLTAASALLAPFTPPGGAVRRATELDLAELTRGRARLELTREKGAGWHIAIGDRQLGWLTEPGWLASSRRRALHAAVLVELHALAELSDEA